MLKIMVTLILSNLNGKCCFFHAEIDFKESGSGPEFKELVSSLIVNTQEER